MKKMSSQERKLIKVPTSKQNSTEHKEDCWRRLRDQYDSVEVFSQRKQGLIDHVVGDWFYKKSAQPLGDIVEQSKQGKFFLALAKSRYLDGFKNSIEKNENEAIRLLNEVITEDPENSAPYLYLALIYQSRGQIDLKERTLLDAKTTQYFNSYLNDFTKTIFSAVETPADLLAAISIWEKTPILDYKKMQNLVMEKRFDKIGSQLVEKALKPENNYRDVNWSLLEYTYGKAILDKFEKGHSLPKTNELIKTKIDFVHNLTDFAELEKTCDINSLNGDVEKIYKYFH